MPAAKEGANDAPTRVLVENPNAPGQSRPVDGAKYAAMRKALLTALPVSSPGLTQAEMLDAVIPRLPEALFPGGDKATWWLKCVQLDLEAKGLVVREATKPLRWRRS